jgi:hypothetical protein
MSETLQILEKLNTFYSGAFTQLITYTVGVLAFIGIVIPFAIATFQNRQMKKDQNSLSVQIGLELTVAKEDLKREIEELMSKREENLHQLVIEAKKEIDIEIKKIDGLAEARALHLQALSMVKTSPAASAFDALTAAAGYAKNKDERNLMAALRVFEDAIQTVQKEDFDQLDIDKACNETVESIDKLNANGRYAEDIKSLMRQIAEAKKRESK